MKKVYIIHGYGGYPEKNWFPWLKAELEKLQVKTEALNMPNTDSPKYDEWLSYMQSQVINPDPDTYFVGHSLGCITILQYLNNLDRGTKVGGAVLVAGFSSPIHFTELNGFFEVPLNGDKIKKVAGKIIAINSDNDPHVPYWQAEEIRDNFDAELIEVKNGLHLNEKAGYKEIPIVLENLKEIMNL